MSENTAGDADNKTEQPRRARWIMYSGLSQIFVGLIVGISVYYVTKEPPPHERLEYQLLEPVSFDFEQVKQSAVALNVRNAGTASATNVRIGLELPTTVKAVDHGVKLSSGPAAEFTTDMSDGNSLKVDVPVLAPGESAQVAVLANSLIDDSASVRVGIKSDSSIARRTTFFSDEADYGIAKTLGTMVGAMVVGLMGAAVTIFGIVLTVVALTVTSRLLKL